MSLLPVEQAYRLAERAEERRWLVTGLWSEEAVGIIGGEHGGGLVQNGRGRSWSRVSAIDCHERKPIKRRNPA